MPDSQLILHVKGTEDQTTELPRQAVRAAIAQGQLSRSQLIWSSAHNAWKQVRELPDLLPSQKLAPAPAPRPRVATGGLPKVAAAPQVPAGYAPKVATGGLPKIVAPGPQVVSAPRIAVKASVAQAATPETVNYRVAEEREGMNLFQWICLGLGAAIVLVIGVNYLLVDEPLSSRLSHTPFAQVTVHGHLGGFLQPGAIVLHLTPSSAVTSANLTSFLVAVAQSTPNQPFSGDPFERVSLTPGWLGQYALSGHAWKELGDMGQEDPAQQKDFLLDRLEDNGGQPLLAPNPNLDDAAKQDARDKAWSDFVRTFTNS